jgi:uncharacterized membrane protein YfcA
VSEAPLDRSLRRMRVAGGLFLATLPAVMVAAWRLPRLTADLSRPIVTLVLAAAGLWLAFSSDRDARSRLDRIKRGFAVHGDEARLLTDFLRVYLIVLTRLELIGLCGLAAAVWGSGPTATIWFVLITAVLMLLAWPSERKARLLLDRARALRPPG